MATIGIEVEHLLSRVVVLEERFDSRPDDVAEQRRRDELIRYVVVPRFDLVLNSFQKVWTCRGTIEGSNREVRDAHREGIRASRRPTRNHL